MPNTPVFILASYVQKVKDYLKKNKQANTDYRRIGKAKELRGIPTNTLIIVLKNYPVAELKKIIKMGYTNIQYITVLPV